MYIPKQFQFEEESEKITFLKQYSFAKMVTTKAAAKDSRLPGEK
ncbi:hypothetical protein [Pedobacter sp. N36a]|nr:hypothetical protein [Pedobacter sp. N36a]